jgi:hypothetical protein
MIVSRFRRRPASKQAPPTSAPSRPLALSGQWEKSGVSGPHRQTAEKRIQTGSPDTRGQHEAKEMQVTHDLDDVDDDVEKAATLYEWRASEHEHHSRNPLWFAVLAAGTTVIVGVMLFVFTNIIGAITVALIGGVMYYVAQQKPGIVRYRIMLDGIALNQILYHWDDLDAFNIIYQPNETKTVIIRSARRFSPYLHMELGDADPVAIREILMEFVTEDQSIEEPIADIIARRLGF